MRFYLLSTEPVRTETASTRCLTNAIVSTKLPGIVAANRSCIILALVPNSIGITPASVVSIGHHFTDTTILIAVDSVGAYVNWNLTGIAYKSIEAIAGVDSRGPRSTHATVVTRYTLRANSNWDVTGNAFESLGTSTDIASCRIHLTQAAIVTSEVFGASLNRDVAGNACEPFRALANILPHIIHSAGATIVALYVRIGANPYGHLTG